MKVAVELLVAAVKTVMTVPMILPHMDLNAVIQPGMNMELIVPIWKATTAGIVPVVNALVTLVVQMVVIQVVNVQMDIYKIV